MQKSNGLFVAYMALNSARLTGSVPLSKPHSTLASNFSYAVGFRQATLSCSIATHCLMPPGYSRRNSAGGVPTFACWQEIRASIGATERESAISWAFNRIQRANEFFAGYLARKSARLTGSAPLSLPHSI